MKNITHNLLKIGLRASLFLLGIFLLWINRPKAMTEKNQMQVEEIADPSPRDQKTSSQVSLLKEPEVTDYAKLESANGRLVLGTRIGKETDKREVYRQLILRGGKLVSLDDNGSYYLLEGKQVTQLPKALQMDPALQDYAYHRPRKIASNEFGYLPVKVDLKKELFLVMPNHFEEGIFTQLESSLQNPLSDYKQAEISIHLSRANHLEFTLESAISRMGRQEIVGETYRGL
jgi:hypothetical protein